MEKSGEWLALAAELLEGAQPDLEGEVRLQQAALALMQAHREGMDPQAVERALQGVVLGQLALALRLEQG